MSEAKPERQMFVNDSHHVTRIAGGEVEDRLTEANQDVLACRVTSSLLISSPALSSDLGFGQECLGSEFPVPLFEVSSREPEISSLVASLVLPLGFKSLSLTSSNSVGAGYRIVVR